MRRRSVLLTAALASAAAFPAGAQAAGWGSTTVLGAADRDVFSAAAASGPGGRTVVAWTSSPTTGYAMRLHVAAGPAGALSGVDADLGPALTPLTPYRDDRPAVAIDPLTGTAVVAWVDDRRTVRAATIPAGQVAPTSTQDLGPADGPIAATAAGGVLAVALHRGGEVLLARTGGLLSPAWSTTRVAPAEAPDEDDLELVAAPGPLGATTVAWLAAGDGPRTSQVHVVDVPAVGPVPAAQALGDPRDQAGGLALARDAAGNGVLSFVAPAAAAWTGPVAISLRGPADGSWRTPERLSDFASASLGPYAGAPPTAAAMGLGGTVAVAYRVARSPSANAYSPGPLVLVQGTVATGLRPPQDRGESVSEGVAVALDDAGTLLTASGSGAFTPASGAIGTTTAPGTPSVLACPAAAAALQDAVITGPGAGVVLWRDDHHAQDVRRLRLAGWDADGPALECARPYPEVVARPSAVPRGEPVTFDGSAYAAPGGSASAVWSWSLDPGSTSPRSYAQTGPERTFTHRFDEPGFQQVTLDLDQRSWRGQATGTTTSGSVAVCDGPCPPPYVPDVPPGTTPPGATTPPGTAPSTSPSSPRPPAPVVTPRPPTPTRTVAAGSTPPPVALTRVPRRTTLREVGDFGLPVVVTAPRGVPVTVTVRRRVKDRRPLATTRAKAGASREVRTRLRLSAAQRRTLRRARTKALVVRATAPGRPPLQAKVALDLR